eukprot:Gb_07981 [translate_table: standard]
MKHIEYCVVSVLNDLIKTWVSTGSHVWLRANILVGSLNKITSKALTKLCDVAGFDWKGNLLNVLWAFCKPYKRLISATPFPPCSYHSSSPPDPPLLSSNSSFLFFDGASKGNPGACSGGGIIFSLSDRCSVSFHLGLGLGSNNIAEFSALILGLRITKLLDLDSLVVYGDSNLVISSLNSSIQIKKVSLSPILKRLHSWLLSFHPLLGIIFPDFLTPKHILLPTKIFGPCSVTSAHIPMSLLMPMPSSTDLVSPSECSFQLFENPAPFSSSVLNRQCLYIQSHKMASSSGNGKGPCDKGIQTSDREVSPFLSELVSKVQSLEKEVNARKNHEAVQGKDLSFIIDLIKDVSAKLEELKQQTVRADRTTTARLKEVHKYIEEVKEDIGEMKVKAEDSSEEFLQASDWREDSDADSEEPDED